MDNITLDTTNFSEQLGLYDFFDVIVSGAVLVFGASAISQTIYTLLWQDITVAKGLGIVLLVYIAGVVLQEIGSILDRHFFRIKHFTRSTFLFDIEDIKTKHKLRYWFWSLLEKNRLIHSMLFKKYAKVMQEKYSLSSKNGKWNWVLSNKTLLDHYRNLAAHIYEDSFPGKKLDKKMYMNEKFNSFVFSVIQYHVSCLGKDKKVEKLRALYSLARTLMICFGMFIIFIPVVNLSDYLKTWLNPRGGEFIITFFIASLFLAILFFFRMKKCKKYMALIMLGNYDASLRVTKKNAHSETEETVKD